MKIAKQRFRNARGRHPSIQENRRNLQTTADALYNDDDNGDDRNPENKHNNVEDVENDSDEDS